MRELTVTLFFLFLATFSLGQNATYSSSYKPIIFVKDTLVDFKTVKQGESATGQIVVSNKGERDLRISNVRGSCGLIVLNFPRSEVKPGESNIINIRYDTSRLGVFKRVLVIHSNSEKNSLKIKVKGEVIP